MLNDVSLLHKLEVYQEKAIVKLSTI